MAHSVQLGHRAALTPAQVEAIARGASLELQPAHWEDVRRSRAFLEQLIGERRRIYGITTGYGPLAGTWVDPGASAELQRGLVYHLSAGVGPLLDKALVRAIMAARAATLVQGHSGIRPESLQLLLECLDADLIPQVPAMGTVGASGDLTPLAHIALGLMGEGHVHYKDQTLPAREALRQAGLEPLRPEGKDALGLVNGTAAMTGIAALNNERARRMLALSAILTLLYGEVLSYQAEALAPGIARVRNHPGQCWAQSVLQQMARSSRRLEPQGAEPPRLPADLAMQKTRLDQPLPQAPYTFRCAPQHLGAVADCLDHHERVTATELGSVTDNPLLFPEEGEVLHGGNFFGQHIALVSDMLNNALITLAVHSERRLARVTDTRLNGSLPPFLRGNDSGLHSGFMGAQVSATALVAELRTHSAPASTQSIPTNANNQDVVTMGTIAARRVGDTLDRLEELLAIECLALAQACDLQGGPEAGFADASAALVKWVRARSAFLGDDRPLAPDIQRIARDLSDRDSLMPLLDGLVKPGEVFFGLFHPGFRYP